MNKSLPYTTKREPGPYVPRLFYSVLEAAESLGVGRTQVFHFIKEGLLRKTKVGKRTLIHTDDLYDFAARMGEAFPGEVRRVYNDSDAARKEGE